ncbi:hypothetical protein B0J15DRAFT_538297 [Fusarium solani]|uniref:Uncharacterized protein n=1 Tax=Fusarium solani TaxID=169388 RepID=A0A9P9K4A2_FUSSL|nr:uncharacterized protein B0J15DRAFT_538297 [Fusarium solani]KAH7239714.1 hypothetical protein B0J15DRAFT_538297 [Fusarium solani]
METPSILKWRSAFFLAKTLKSLPGACFDLRRCLHNVPSLPDAIPADTEYIEGHSLWTNSGPNCSLKTRKEKPKRIYLSKLHATSVSASSSPNFRAWETNANNVVALLTLAERQGIPMMYGRHGPSIGPSPHPGAILDLDYASIQEKRWWKSMVSLGTGWSMAGTRISLWATGIDDDDKPPPTASEAACYLSRLCDAYDLSNQSSAALAAALTIPLHADISFFDPSEIELPQPTFATSATCSVSNRASAEFDLIDHLMTLSLSPWDPEVPCNFAGYWLLPIAASLQPIINQNKMEVLAKAMSPTIAGPLWLGLAICAAWTGAAASFLDHHQTRSSCDDTVSRANVWRLQHDCYQNYLDDGFSHTPPYGWPPFGHMRATDVELEIRDHLKCSRNWTYTQWQWSFSGTVDHGFSLDRASDRPSKEASRRYALIPSSEMHGQETMRKISEVATKTVFCMKLRSSTSGKSILLTSGVRQLVPVILIIYNDSRGHW